MGLKERESKHLNDNVMNNRMPAAATTTATTEAKLSLSLFHSSFRTIFRIAHTNYMPFCSSSNTPASHLNVTNGKNKFVCWISLMDLMKKKKNETKRNVVQCAHRQNENENECDKNCNGGYQVNTYAWAIDALDGLVVREHYCCQLWMRNCAKTFQTQPRSSVQAGDGENKQFECEWIDGKHLHTSP